MKARGVRSILSLALLTILVKCYRSQKPLEGSGKNTNELLEENLASLESTFGVPTESSTNEATESSQRYTEKSLTTKYTEYPSSTSTPKNLNSTKFDYDEYMCTCDLTKNSCDINCCCDEECSPQDKRAFNGCKTYITSAIDPRYCYQNNVIDKNNSPNKVTTRFVGGEALFCILIDNQKDDFRYLDRDGSTNISNFEDLVSRHKGYIWPDIQEKIISQRRNPKAKEKRTIEKKQDVSNTKQLVQMDNVLSIFNAKHYTVGGPIWIYYDKIDQLGILCLPQSFNERECNTASPVRYMEDLEDTRKCQRRLYHDEECSSPEFDVKYYFDGFKAVKSPEHFKNFTENVPKAKSPFLDMEYFICHKSGFKNDESKVCTKRQESDLTSLATKKDCRNVLTGLNFEVYHEGTRGINKIRVSIELTDYSLNRTFWEVLHQDFMIIEQSFSYQHIWSNENSTDIVKRSGRPGYQFGMPIRSGRLSQVVMNDEKTSFQTSKKKNTWIIERNENDQYLTTMGGTLTGNCDELSNGTIERNQILFGENIRTGCSFHLTRDELSNQCQRKRKEILNLLLGGIGIGGDRMPGKIRVAKFGDSEVSKPGDWIPIMLSNLPPDAFKDSFQSESPIISGQCRNMVLNLHIEIAYAKIGSFSNPQPKIMGVNYKFGTAQDISYQCIGIGACQNPFKKQRIEIFSSVQFLDVTLPASDYYAEYPVIEARLPHDFFYPFLTSTESSGIKTNLLYIQLLLVALLSTIYNPLIDMYLYKVS